MARLARLILKGQPVRRVFSIFGDSISTFEGCIPSEFAVYYEGERTRASGVIDKTRTWWHRVAAHYGAPVIANGSYSGSMVAGEGFPAATSPERIASLTGPNGEAPTDILVFLGINDYGWGGTANQLAGHSAAAPRGAHAPKEATVQAGVSQSQLDEFATAYRLLVERLRDAYPTAQLWCLTLPSGRMAGSPRPTFTANLRGIPLASYNQAILKAARSAGAQGVDIASFGYDYEAIDGTHPTALGMAQLAALVIAAMEGQTEPDSQAFQSQDLWRASVLCPDRSCAGCSSAHNTGNQWDCVCKRALAPYSQEEVADSDS